jgi:hypothetical protein
MTSPEDVLSRAVSATQYTHDAPEVVPPYVARMVDEWAAAAQRLGANVASLTGLGTRAVRLLAGGTRPSRSEAQVLDNALGTDAARLLPALRSATVPQPVPAATIRFRPDAPTPKTWLPPEPKPQPKKRPPPPKIEPASVARAREWDVRLRESGRTIADISRSTGLGQGRLYRIFRTGSRDSVEERRALIAALKPSD